MAEGDDMKSLTPYQKSCLFATIGLVLVLLFIAPAIYKGIKKKEPPQTGSSIPAYPAAIVNERLKDAEPIVPPVGVAFTPAEVIVDNTACNCLGNVRLLSTTYNGETIYKVEQCDFYFFVDIQKSKNLWKEVFGPTHNKAKAMKEYTKLKKEYDIMKAEEEISKLKWKVVK